MIFCVEDDAAIRNLMIYALKGAGFNAQGYENSEEFWHALEKHMPEMILLDIMLPGEDGLTMLRKLRSRSDTMRIPIIMTTAKGEEYDKVIALDYGADDYLAKPFGMMEMVSRVRAVLRRFVPRDQGNEIMKVGSLEMNTVRHTVSVDDEDIRLTLKEFEMLRLMLSEPGRVFTRDNLLALVWNDDYEGETRTVDVHIGTLRAKLGKCSALIETVRGVGYRIGGGL